MSPTTAAVPAQRCSDFFCNPSAAYDAATHAICKLGKRNFPSNIDRDCASNAACVGRRFHRTHAHVFAFDFIGGHRHQQVATVASIGVREIVDETQQKWLS